MKHYLQTTERDYEHAIEVTQARGGRNRSENRSGTAPYQARTVPQAENDDLHNSVQRKKKRPHAKTCDRSIWRIGDSNRNSQTVVVETRYGFRAQHPKAVLLQALPSLRETPVLMPSFNG